MITTRTPLRISLLGGGTDLPAFTKKNVGKVVSFAINKYVYISVNKKFDGKLRVSYSQTETVNDIDELKHELARETLRLFNIKTGLEITSVSDIPGNGTGLGSSSAFTVGLIKALGRNVPPSILAERAFTIEAEKCFHPVGKQDQYISAHGGINHFIFDKNFVKVDPINPPLRWVEEMESHSLLLWTGISRNANDILKAQSKTYTDGGNVGVGVELASMTGEFYYELLDGMTVKRTGEYLNQAWKLKKFLAQGISNSKIDTWYDLAMLNGAYGGKLLGAGGGGFLYVLAPPYLHEQIMKVTGLRHVEFKIEKEGSKVIYES